MVAIFFLLLAGIGIGYTVVAALVAGRFRQDAPPAARPEPATLLKPLHGAEPLLVRNLMTFLDQRWDAPIELVCGVNRSDDPAIAAVAPLAGRLTIVTDAPPIGANAKIANLANMLPAASHDLLIISDSDMAVAPDYLQHIAAALAAPGVGAVTCLYRGRGDAGVWSRLAAGGISYHFLPSVLVGLALGLARPCMGSTIALRRATLDAIGGFAPFADRLADDYAIGVAVRDLGLTIAIPPTLLDHGCSETSLAALARHELRWAVTVRTIDPVGHIGSIATHPLPFALLALPFAPLAGGIATIAALAVRLWLIRRIDRLSAAASMAWWWLPGRDCLSFVIFLASLVARSVDWRGQALRIGSRGDGTARVESIDR